MKGRETNLSASDSSDSATDGSADGLSLSTAQPVTDELVVDDRVMREILTRRGQARFRQALFSVFNTKCCVTGCKVPNVLEAAHITPHSDTSDYRVTNGLLLRSDIHTLFDLQLIGVDAKGYVHIAPALNDSIYADFRGARIADSIPSAMAEALGIRFSQFEENFGRFESAQPA